MKFCIMLLSMTLFSDLFAANFTNESELGIAVASGNSKTKNFNARQENTYAFSANLFKLSALYVNAYSNNVESARYLFGALRYERALGAQFSIYMAQGFESDIFAKYDLRHLSDLGGKYFIIKEDLFIWLAEAGYRYTYEKRTNASHDYRNSLRAYTEVEKKWNPGVSSKYYFEYLPNLDDNKDYQMNSEISISAALNSIFSIKTAYLLRYDRIPAPGTVTKTDTLFTTALVAKF